MLLDQKRTQRIVKITAILTSVAFGGIAIFAILAIIFGFGMGAGENSDSARIEQAQERVKSQPENAAAWDQLATAQYVGGNTTEAVKASRKAIALAPHDFARTQTLARIFTESGDPGKAIVVLQQFIDKNPQNAQAYLQLGGAADAADKPQIARLAYLRFLQMDPQNPSAPQVKEQIKQLSPTGAPAG